MPQIERTAAMLARAGLLAEIEPIEGGPRYGLTWKGFASLQGENCFRFASSERMVAVHSFQKVRVQNGSDVYRVMATSVPERIELWMDDPEFTALFPGMARRARGSVTPVEYEVALWEGRFVVIKIPDALQTNPPPVPPRESNRNLPLRPEQLLAQAGKMDSVRALALLREHERSPFVQRRVCLKLPTASVDETNFFEAWQKLRQSGAPAGISATLQIHFVIYNAGRLVNDDEQKVAYEFFRRLEAVGFARSAQLPATEWKGSPAKGKTRFELTPAGMAILAPDDPGCMKIGEFSVAEVLRTEDFSMGNLRPKFQARSTFTPDRAAVALIAQMGHLKRLQEVGGASHGQFGVLEGRLTVDLIHELVFFGPDPRNIKLPAYAK